MSRAELDCLVVPWRNGASRIEVYQMAEGWDALRQAGVLPATLAADPPGFRGAALSFLDSDDDHLGEHEDRYTMFAASFETVEDAQNGFESAVAHHESADGWGFSTDQLDPDYNSDPGLGDEGVYYIDGADYGYPEISVYLWRTRNLLLQAVDYHPYDQPDLITKIAQRMAALAEQRYACAGLGS